MHGITFQPVTRPCPLARRPSLPKPRLQQISRLPLCRASGGQGLYNREAVEELRKLLKAPGLHQGPCAHDAISAKLIGNAGFPFSFMSGFCVSAAALAEPDAGLISYAEMVAQGAAICRSARHGTMPVIGDADTGYGNALNVKRTVRGYAAAGFAGILLEDQVAPKACGHTKNRRVVSRREAVSKIRAAVDARDEGAGILIAARSDARAGVSLEEALWRAQAFADEGADIVFIDALQSKEEMQQFCKVAPDVAHMANMLEGGGKTPICTIPELEDMGYKIVAYPLSMLGVSIRAMENALLELKAGNVAEPPTLPTFSELKEIVGFNEYYREEERYAISIDEEEPMSPTQKFASQREFVEVEVVMDSFDSTQSGASESGPGRQYQQIGGDISEAVRRSAFGGRWLRLKITNADGVVQLDTRFPANFMGAAAMVPGVAGMDLETMLREVLPKNNEAWPQDGKTHILDVTNNGQRIEVTIDDGK